MGKYGMVTAASFSKLPVHNTGFLIAETSETTQQHKREVVNEWFCWLTEAPTANPTIELVH